MLGLITQSKTESVQTANEKRYAQIEELAGKAMQGDNDALGSLCEMLTRSILFRTKYFLGNAMDAEDAAQNVLLRICEKIQNLQNPKAFSAWVSRIVVNETRNYVKVRAKHETYMDIQDCSDELIEENAGRLPDECAEEKSVRQAVMEIISHLPTRQREALLLHYYDDLKVTEVATAMGIPHQSVSRYLTLAREKLRSELEKAGLDKQFTTVRLEANRVVNINDYREVS